MLKTLLDGQFPDNLPFCLTERPIIPTPDMDYDDIEIPGRDGTLTIENGYKNITIPCEYNILEDYNVKALTRKIKAFFLNKKTLRFSDDTVFYKIKKIQFSDIENDIEEYGLFKITFELDPFQYELTSAFDITKPGIITNPGSYKSLPYLKIYGSGTLVINNQSIIIQDVADYIELDCDIGNAYKGQLDMNEHMRGEFPFFKVGENSISWSGNITKISGHGNWRHV